MKKKAILSLFLALTLLAPLFLPEKAAADEQPDTLPYVFGTETVYSTFKQGEPLTDGFYYTDDWFFGDPAERNDSLALLSMQLTASSIDGEDGAGIRFLKDLGFDETGFYNSGAEDPDGCNYTWGKKEISSGKETCTLIAVVLQSYALDRPTKKAAWKQNFRINGDTPSDEHYAFQAAVDKHIDSVAGLSGSGKVKYWIMGQSRGGALAGILAAKLPEKLSAAGSDIYAYTFEAPAVINGDAMAGKEGSFPYIHNYLCSDDIVTMIPPWGMVRYGTDYILNTPEVDKNMPAELKKLSPAAAELLDNDSPPDIETMAKDLLNTLTAALPSREDYSTPHTDTFTDEDGNEVTITRSYQDLFTRLMDFIFSDSLREIDTSGLSEHLSELAPAIKDLVKAVSEDSDSCYYSAAKQLGLFLKNNGIELPFSDEDFYAVLKLAGPRMVDLSYVPENDPPTDEDYLSYLTPLIVLVASKDFLILPHQFETLIARLKALAPAPEISSLDITIPEPAAEDAASLAPQAAASYIDSLGNDWMSAEANWDSNDDTLRDNRVYYFDFSLTAAGAGIPEDFTLTLNGRDPVRPVSVTYKDGCHIISGTWEITLGTPETYTVSFDTAGRAEAPVPVSLKAGQQLKYALSPEIPGTADSDGKTWAFDNWFSEDGQSWDSLTVENDITLYAGWIELIDTVSVALSLPHVGETFKNPTVPEGCGYHVEEVYFETEDYEEASEAAEGTVYKVYFTLYCDSEKIRFLNEVEDDDEEEEFCTYTGRLLINDKEQVLNTYEDRATDLHCENRGEYVSIVYYFEPLPAEDPSAASPAGEDPAAPDQTAPTQAANISTPDTGDSDNPGLWAGLLAAAALACMSAVRRKRKA